MANNVCIFGGGSVVTEYYIPAYLRRKNENIKCIVDPSEGIDLNLKNTGFNSQLVKKKYKDCWNDIEKIGGFESIIIALPNAYHEHAALEALNRGYNVLIEKPLAMNSSGCLKIKNKSEEKNLVAASGMVRRYLPAFMAMREAIKNDLLGQIWTIEIEDGEYFPWLSDTGYFFKPESGGILADMGVHYLDMVYAMFGEIEPMSYKDDFEGGVEANCELLGLCKNNISLTLRLSRDRRLVNLFSVKGSKGVVKIEKDNQISCYFSPKNSNLIHEIKPRNPYYSSDLPNDFVSSFCQQIDDFSKAVNRKPSPIPLAGEAAHVMGVIEWSYASRPRKTNLVNKNPIVSDCLPTATLVEGPILITGGNGFIGSRLVEKLCSEGNRAITAPVRSYKRVVELARFGINMPRVNLLDPIQVREQMTGKRWVVHLAYGNDGIDAGKFTIDSTKVVVEEAIKAGVEAIVVLSTAWVYGLSKNPEVINENSRYRPFGGSDYASSKIKMQKWLLEKAKRSKDTRIIVLNPTCVWGIQGKTYTRLPYQLAKKGQFCWIESGKGIANLLKVESLIDAILLSLQNKDAHGHNFIINDEVLSWREFISPLLKEHESVTPDYSEQTLLNVNKRKFTGLNEIVRAVYSNKPLKLAISGLPYIGSFIKSIGEIIKKNKLDGFDYVNEVSEIKTNVDNPPIWLNELFGPYQTVFCADKAKEILKWRPRNTTLEYRDSVTKWIFTVEKF